MKKMIYLLKIFLTFGIFIFWVIFFTNEILAQCISSSDCAPNQSCHIEEGYTVGNCINNGGVMIGKKFELFPNHGIDDVDGYDSIGTFLSTTIIPNVMVVANIILFIMIFASGFSVISSTGNPEKNKNAKATLTASIIGFVIIFAAYWIMEVLGIIIGYNPLGGS